MWICSEFITRRVIIRNFFLNFKKFRTDRLRRSSSEHINMRILYTGGGTLGSVSPLVALHQRLSAFALATLKGDQANWTTADKLQNKKKDNVIADYKFLWLGTKNGVERNMIEKEGIPYKSIPAGKLRRYFDLRNLIDLFKIKLAFWQAFFILKKFKPEIILSAGGFVSVPVVWAGWLLKIPSIIHQQDVQPGLANKLMAPMAARITVALDISLKDYPKKKTILVGNPVRDMRYEIRDKNIFKFNNNLPTVLVVGGGTGALAINKLIEDSLEKLIKFCNIIHVTGKGKSQSVKESRVKDNYKAFEFLDEEMYVAIQTADLIISRAGMSALTELAYFSKPTIVIPIPNSHQEKNAQYFSDHSAVEYLDQKDLTGSKLSPKIKELLENKNKLESLSKNIHQIFVDYSGEKIIQEIKEIILKK